MAFDVKDPKNQKILVAALAFLIVIYFWYSRVYTSYAEQIDTKTQEFETVTTHLKSVEMKAKSLDALKLEYQELLSRYEEIEALLPEVKMIPSILVQLHTASSLTGTKVSRVQPLPIESADFYDVASFEIEMTGTYHDFGQFVSYVANFPFIANLANMEIQALNVANPKDTGPAPGVDEGSPPQEVNKKDETLTATFVLSTYFVKEGERLKALSL